jgi:ribosomal protein S18 acetylase RimI-like enzyme
MRAEIDYLSNKASEVEIAEHLSRCDADFVPPLSGRVEINEYAKKIANKATRFEAWSGGTLVCLVAAYCNDHEKHIVYITSVSVLRKWAGKSIVYRLMNQCIEHAKALGMRQISLEVASGNTSAIKLYEKSGFVTGRANAPFVRMDLNFKSEEEHEQQA